MVPCIKTVSFREMITHHTIQLLPFEKSPHSKHGRPTPTHSSSGLVPHHNHGRAPVSTGAAAIVRGEKPQDLPLGTRLEKKLLPPGSNEAQGDGRNTPNVSCVP